MNALKGLIFITIALILSGCKPSEDKAISIGQSEYSQTLKDPDSAKYKELYFKTDKSNGNSELSGYVCGMVNAKNGFGAYVGFRPFYIHVSVEPRFIVPAFGVGYSSSDAGTILEVQNFGDFRSRCGDKPKT